MSHPDHSSPSRPDGRSSGPRRTGPPQHVPDGVRGRRRPRPVTVVLGAVAVSGLLALLSACGTAGAEQAPVDADGRTVVRYEGSVGQVTPTELAADLGYFEKITLEHIGDSTGGPASIQNAVTNATDYGGAFNGAIIKLADAGSPITSVLSYYGSDELTFGGYYTVEGSPITGPRDLIGKKIGINTLGAQAEFVIREWLDRGGLTPEEVAKVELIVVPPVNAEQAVREGQVDVVGLSFVFRDRALERGGLTKLFNEVDLFGPRSYGTYVLRDQYIEQNPEVVEDFVQGTARAIRWSQVTPLEEVHARFTRIIEGRGRQETTDLVPHWKSYGIATPGGVIVEEEITTWIDWLEREGQLEEGRFTFDDIATNEFNPYANGTYDADAGPDGEPVEVTP